MDANQFTQQLVQFSSVEQAIKTNDALGQLLFSSSRTKRRARASGSTARRLRRSAIT
jgi:flagellar basal-body rod modification protein FlgD